MTEAGDITEGEVAGHTEAEVDIQGVKMLEGEVDIKDTQRVRRHTWWLNRTMARQRTQK